MTSPVEVDSVGFAIAVDDKGQLHFPFHLGKVARRGEGAQFRLGQAMHLYQQPRCFLGYHPIEQPDDSQRGITRVDPRSNLAKIDPLFHPNAL